MTGEAAGPRPRLREALERLRSLGPGIVVARGEGFSANLLGTPGLGTDGGETVMRVSGCDCHVHVSWSRVTEVVVAAEDVGFGPEPVVRLMDESGRAVVSVFYPRRSRADVERALQGR